MTIARFALAGGLALLGLLAPSAHAQTVRTHYQNTFDARELGTVWSTNTKLSISGAPLTTFNGIDSRSGSATTLFGAQLKEDARRFHGCMLGFGAQGTMLPNDGSFCELDPELKDQWGIPVLRFHWKWSDFELNQVRHQQKHIRELLEAMGGKVKPFAEADVFKSMKPGGSVIQEVGGAIMGSDAAASVTNQWSQTWDVKNVFLADGAPFASTADKNPTLTIMALAWRMADHLMDELKKGNI